MFFPIFFFFINVCELNSTSQNYIYKCTVPRVR